MVKQKTAAATIVAQIPAARIRAERERNAGRRAASAHYDQRSERIVMELTNGYLFGFPVRAIAALAAATPRQLAAVEISPAGSALHWKDLDVDLSVPGLLLSAIRRSDKLSELARIAGTSTSDAKAAAARANGAKGGRPRKEARS